MSIRVKAAALVSADPATVWAALTDWPGQSNWIPLTTVDIVSDHDEGLGVRANAFSGVTLGRLKLGLMDRFVVTGWSPPEELEVLHLGPMFTGEGVFTLTGSSGRTKIICTEVCNLPGGRPVETAARLVVPLLRVGLQRSLRKLATLIEKNAGT